MEKIIKKIVELRKNELIEEAEKEYEKQVSLIKENLPKAAAPRRKPILEKIKHLKAIIKNNSERRLYPAATSQERMWRVTDHSGLEYFKMIQTIKAKKSLKELEKDLNENYYVRTKSQKSKVRKILLNEILNKKLKKLKYIEKSTSQKLEDFISQKTITPEYMKHITKEFAKKNNLFFYIEDLDTFNPSESVKIDENMLVIPLEASISDLNIINQRIVVDVSHDWSTRSGSAWGTRYAGFYGGIEDGTAFIERIPYGTGGIKDAEEWLKPASVKQAEAEGRCVKRQGDLFFISMKRRTDIKAPKNHKIEKIKGGLLVKHDQHPPLKLEGEKWKAVQRKTMASYTFD